MKKKIWERYKLKILTKKMAQLYQYQSKHQDKKYHWR